MKRRYNHKTKQWDIVLSEEQYNLLINRISSLATELTVISQPKREIFQVTGQPCYPPFFTNHVAFNGNVPDALHVWGGDN